jgi:hypothetical protein
MKKTTYLAPAAEFVCLATDADILTGSFNVPGDEHQKEYGSSFVF